MKPTSLFIILAICFGVLSSQSYEAYSNDKLQLYSEHLKDSITLNVHKPETLEKSNSETKYPVTIIFDSQHSMTYPRIINSFDFLTLEALIPETIIIGVPFNFKNRTYLTSNETKAGDTLMGIERMENFLFKELLPKLKTDLKANDFLMLIGHSRTAFLVNYLLTRQSSEINAAVALSGFYKEYPLNEGAFENYLINSENFPYPLHYFLTVGSSMEESPYKKQYDTLNSFIATHETPDNLNFNYHINPLATHMVNYWMSIPQILMQTFQGYGELINQWLYSELKDSMNTQPLKRFKADLQIVSGLQNFQVNPSITHIFSFANFYRIEKDFTTAIGFVKLGLHFYPDYLDFYPFIIDLFESANQGNEKTEYIKRYRIKVNNDMTLTESEKRERLKAY